MHRFSPLALLVCSIAAPLAGCTKHDSNDILTNGMYGAISVTATGDGSSRVRTTLYFGQPIGLNFIELEGDDQLIAVADGESRALSKSTDVLNIVHYSALFDVDADGTHFDVQFLRTLDDGAPSSTCTLPPPFDFVDVPAEDVSRQAELFVEWDNGALDEMRWDVTGGCLNGTGGVLGTDTQSVSIPAGTIVGLAGAEEDSCIATLTITRSREGIIDPGYGEGGHIECNQVRSLTFTSAP